jgi:hypothetical protein
VVHGRAARTRSRPSGNFKSFHKATKASASAISTWASIRRAPSRATWYLSTWRIAPFGRFWRARHPPRYAAFNRSRKCFHMRTANRFLSRRHLAVRSPAWRGVAAYPDTLRLQSLVETLTRRIAATEATRSTISKLARQQQWHPFNPSVSTPPQGENVREAPALGFLAVGNSVTRAEPGGIAATAPSHPDKLPTPVRAPRG